ncbi:MAG: carbonic anhydrase [Patescibacteria group bacterium]
MSHNCKNFLLCCMDFRLQTAIINWLSVNGYTGDTDIILVPGSCKVVAENQEGCQAGLILDGIRLSYEKHGVRRFFLTMHEDCGAYGGQSAFVSAEAETSKHLTDMKKVRDFLKEKYPDAEVKSFRIKKSDDGWEFEEIAE